MDKVNSPKVLGQVPAHKQRYPERTQATEHVGKKNAIPVDVSSPEYEAIRKVIALTVTPGK